MRLANVIIFSCLIWLPALAAAEVTEDEKRFAAAKKALDHGNLSEFYSIKHSLVGHHLYVYLEYYFIQSNYDEVDATVIENFIGKYPESPLAAQLLRKKLTHYAEAGNWEAFLREYPPEVNSTSLKCYYIQALQHTKPEDSVNHLIKPLWLYGKDRPNSCTAAFEQWLTGNLNKDKLIWQRFQLALKAYNFKLAKYLIAKMNTLQTKEANDILRLYAEPGLVTHNSYLNTQPSAEVISYGVYRLARRDPANAIRVYNNLSKRYQFNAEQKQRIFQNIALKFAMRKNKQSSDWFQKIVDYDLDILYREWSIRSALYHGHWDLVKRAIDTMPKSERDTPRWTYWYARALDKLGQKDSAQLIFTKLVGTRSYHGFLASQHLAKKVEVKHEPLEMSKTAVAEVEAVPAFKRAKSLYKLDQKHDARLELNYLMKNSNKKQQLIIMHLVSDWGWYSQALRLSYHAEYQDDVHLRFPLAYYDIVMANAKKRKVDPALVYAIMRQESYFSEKAGSRSGAIGLMQLMPATALRTSKQYKLKYEDRSDLLNGETNISFGSAHLDELHKQFRDHPILIIAAYNAGKNAVYRWMPKDKRVPADIWIETVPFHETRNYIKNVVAGYIIYQFRLGQKPDLGSIMRVIR